MIFESVIASVFNLKNETEITVIFVFHIVFNALLGVEHMRRIGNL